MSMIKRFFEKKKLDVKFKVAGKGHKLNEETKRPSDIQAGSSRTKEVIRLTPSESAQRAAEAAIARGQSRDGPSKAESRIKVMVQNELEKERKALAEAERLKSTFQDLKVVEVEKPSALKGVFFTCPQLFDDEFLSKEAMEERIRDYLHQELTDNPAEAAALMIYTFTKSSEVIQKCCGTLYRILDNVIKNPSEPKFRRLRLSNPRFAEQVVSVEGAVEFLKAVGFIVEQLPSSGDAGSAAAATEGDMEDYLVLPVDKAENTERLEDMKKILDASEPILPVLYRDTKVFVATGYSLDRQVRLPDEFFAFSEAELRREQELRQRAVEESGMLLTKAMREKMRQKELRRFRYAVIRVRFPDNLVLQGTFYATEKLSRVVEWMSECLEFPWVEYTLTPPQGGRLTEMESGLVELGLAPCSVIKFSYDKEKLRELVPAECVDQVQYVKDQYLEKAVPL